MGDGTQRRKDVDGVDDALNKENRVRKRRFALHRIRHGVMAFNFQGEVWYSKDPDSYFEEQGQSLRFLSFVSQCFIALRDTFQLPATALSSCRSVQPARYQVFPSWED
jgi:hypothetical protein